MELTWTTDRVPLGSLIEYEKNPVQISKRDARELAKSLKKFGHIIPYTAAAPKNGADVPILDGHQRKKVEIELLNVSPSTLVEVRFPSRALTEKERQEAIIRLRKNTGEFDPDALLNWFEADDLLEWGFDEKELGKIGFEFGGSGDAEPEIDRAAELLEKWGVQSGDLWLIGDHRLICGDCTDAATVARVMDGEKTGMMVTDPPYGVDVAGGTRDPRDEANYRSGGKVENDAISDEDLSALLLSAFTHARQFMDSGASYYIWHPAVKVELFSKAVRESLAAHREIIIWSKENFVFGRYDYHWQHEPCFYGWIEGAHKWFGSRDQSTIWQVEKVGTDLDKKIHPTAKPLGLTNKALQNSTEEGYVVYDPFSGSGTTLVACENLRRRCRAIEISPAYVAVALERMSQAFEGIEIRKVE